MKSVTKFLILSGLSGLAVGLIGCGKPSDLGRMQEDAKGLAQRALPEVTELQARLATIKARTDKATTARDHQQVTQTVGRADQILRALKTELDGAPAKIDAAAKSGELELQHETDELREHVSKTTTIATAYIQTAESWMHNVDTGAAAIPAPAAGSGGIYLSLGAMASKTGNANDAKLLEGMAKATSEAFAKTDPKLLLTWAGGAPTREALDEKHVAGFFLDGAIAELTEAKADGKLTIKCKVNLQLTTFPEKNLLGMISGGASVAATTKDADKLAAQQDCVDAVISSLIETKVVPTIKARLAPATL
ncbi:MAG: hypothetical protein NT062_30285 [Proteobacteria bacterium]|nr:hypothetical protein [Pseudomonadota bacterium]